LVLIALPQTAANNSGSCNLRTVAEQRTDSSTVLGARGNDGGCDLNAAS
jgi:hypothetical protein